MSITLSPEADAKAQQIPEFTTRLEHFINEQFALEEWRQRRRTSEVSAVISEGLKAGAELRASHADREALFARLAELTERLSHAQ